MGHPQTSWGVQIVAPTPTLIIKTNYADYTNDTIIAIDIFSKKGKCLHISYLLFYVLCYVCDFSN